MDDLQLIEAIRAVVKEETSSIRADLEKTEQSIRADLEKTEQSIRADLEKTEQSIRADLEKTDRELRVLIENGPEKVAKLLREDYARLSSNSEQGAEAAKRCDQLESTVASHEHALRNHNGRLTELEQKAI